MKQIKIGDLVEDCSLMPCIVMKIDGDAIRLRRLDVDEYANEQFSECSILHCGIVKLTSTQAFNRLKLGIQRLGSLWDSDWEKWEDYDNLIQAEASK